MWWSLVSWWHRRDTRARIRRHGWTAIYVGDYRSAPTWVYTVGFDETLNQPEVVIFDLPRAAAAEVLWDIFTELKDKALVFEDGKVWRDSEGHPSVWRKVHPSQIDSDENWFGLAVGRRAEVTGQPFGLEVFQLVLSDGEGRLPWADGYDERLRPLQPELYLPRAPVP